MPQALARAVKVARACAAEAVKAAKLARASANAAAVREERRSRYSSEGRRSGRASTLATAGVAAAEAQKEGGKGEASRQQPGSSPSPERIIEFGEGPLGISLVLSTNGKAVVKTIKPGTQAERRGVRIDDVLCEIGSGAAATNLRGLMLHQGVWDEVVIRPLQNLSRPLALVVVAGSPSDTVPKRKPGS